MGGEKRVQDGLGTNTSATHNYRPLQASPMGTVRRWSMDAAMISNT